ncbi:hypothetical protein SAMN04488519_106210 [Algoriphagus ornithinivorans]|uniref:DUF541 domain-containing protein n=1 Tax=Algoriphagus ornithinivorans TaxID=226506 RepID=A0A1I5H0P7_9BACT|nr:SIMPL domain-containing protein [Algoriphagus ornithinivorans]SFO41874.1 hypothetical protein SAMN04488519_106210 [Algoriphagus ornithinivorans]
MKKIALTLLAAIFGFQVFAQQIQQVPLIEVEGFAERLISPDEAVFNIMLEEKGMKVSDATKILNNKTQRLADLLKKAKIKDYKLIADNYSVDINRIYRSGVSRDSGYVARQTLRIVTGSKNEDLQKIAEAIQESGDMSFNLSFQVSETAQKSLENSLLTDALRNAQSRALLIAETLGIRNISVYHVSVDSPPSPVPMFRIMADQASEQSQIKLAPDSQKINRRVYVKYTY